VVGKLARKFIKGDLIALKQKDGIVVKGDVTLDDKIISKDQNIVMDVGTDNIQGYEVRLYEHSPHKANTSSQ
jgi:hypothetical protein